MKKLRRFAAMLMALVMALGAFTSVSAAGVTLPSALTVIEDEAFAGIPLLETLTLPDNVKHIGEYAFADSGLLYISIPGSVESIADNAFANCNLMAIYCEPGSVAEQYALEHGIVAMQK